MAHPLLRLLPSLPASCHPRFPHHSPPPRRATSYSSSRPHLPFAASLSASVAPSPAPDAELPAEPRTRLIAQNIPWDCTADDIRVLFEKHGSVVDVELSMYSSSKNRGLAFVTMGSEGETLAALNNLNSTSLNGRTIKVDFARARKKQPVVPPAPLPKYDVFVGNLTWRVRSRHLRELFASTPDVLSVEVIFHTNPRRSAGYGFVSFSSKEAADIAIATFNGKKLMGRSIIMMYKDENAKKKKSSVPKKEEPEVVSSEQSDG